MGKLNEDKTLHLSSQSTHEIQLNVQKINRIRVRVLTKKLELCNFLEQDTFLTLTFRSKKKRKMSNLVSVFGRHFINQQRGRIPYQRGFILIGRLPSPKRREAAPSRTNMALASVSASTAVTDKAAQLVGNGKPVYLHRQKPAKSQKVIHRKRPAKTSKKTVKHKPSARPNKEAL